MTLANTINWLTTNALTLTMGFALFVTLVALVMTFVNLRLYAPPPQPTTPSTEPSSRVSPRISVCIPARNEERNIGEIIRDLLAQSHQNLEVLVYDDQSTDATGRIVADLAAADPRVRVVPTVPLPDGWNGKQHACYRCSQHASGEWLLFTDADVRFAPTAIAGALASAHQRGAAMVSTFPRQITGSLGESLVVPMIFFILLSYLPLPRMRTTKDPNASAACGQFLFVRKDAYDAIGGHTAFRDTMHDGVKMPRALRRAGYQTDLFDGTAECSCRMYTGLPATWRGFTKNAFEGLGSIGLLVFITVLHLVGHVLPWLLCLAALAQTTLSTTIIPIPTTALIFAGWCVGCQLIHRALLATRFRQDWRAVALHPIGILLMTAIQWRSFYLHITGKRSWRGRTAGKPTTAIAGDAA